MRKQIIQTSEAPKAIGPYSQAVRVGELVFLSGQIPLDPATGNVVEGDIVVQTRRVMENLGAVLSAAGASFAEVVKTTIFLADLGHFSKMNEVYGTYFASEPPARATVQVGALPRGVLIEIDMIAHLAAGA
ncbi:MAG TPA: RidA family protein [Polyangiaceae bacterium]|nr:RidA family protein [Polyangiaceae bacterium]